MKKYIYITIIVLISLSAKSQGWKSDTAIAAKIPQKPIEEVSVYNNLPKAVDLSKYVPSVMDQGILATCIPVASTYYLRTMLEAMRLGITNENGYTKIDALRYSPTYVFASIRKDPINLDCKGYTLVEDAMETLKTKGSVLLAELEYSKKCNNPDTSKFNPKPESQILDYVRLFSLIDDGNKVNATKKSLAENLPLVVCLEINVTLKKMGRLNWIWHKIKAFFGFEDEDFALWKPKDEILKGGHGVCVVGYDDAKFGNKGAFKMVNSRGEYWGEDGYFWVLYSDYERLAKLAYQAIMPKVPKEDIKYSGEVSYLTNAYGDVNDLFSPESEAEVLKNYNTDSTSFLTSYSFKESVKHRSHFRFSVKTQNNFYIYILDENKEKQKINIVFPQEYDDSTSNEVKKDKKYDFPLQKNDTLKSPNWVLRGPKGKEKVMFLFSTKKLCMYDIHARLNELKGMTFDEKVNAVLGKDLIPQEYIDYDARDPKKMKFYVNKKFTQGSIVPLIFSYDHI